MLLKKYYSDTKSKLFTLSFLFLSIASTAQEKNAFFVRLSMEKSQAISVEKIISQRAIDRRLREGIRPENILSYDDFPINTAAVAMLSQDTNLIIRYGLKWHNALVVESDLLNIDYLKSKYDFIQEIKYVGRTAPLLKEHKAAQKLYNYVKDPEVRVKGLNPSDYGKSYNQIAQIGIDKLHSNGLSGMGVWVAVFDAGFLNAHTIPAFMHLTGNRRLHLGLDVVDMDSVLTDSDNHGTACLSCVATFDKGQYIGSAPGANYFLFRTENGISEYPLEELNWCKAAEIADSIGIDVITSSLGYNQFDDKSLSYAHKDLDGNTAYVSISAAKAVEKGILVHNSAGNSGEQSWRKIGFPADVPGVITIGAVDIDGKAAIFTSQGYNAKGEVKPNISGMGFKTAVASPKGGYYFGNGTSYSTPLVAGGTICLKEAFPNLSSKVIKNAIQFTASHSLNPDSFIGYGVADFYAAYEVLKAPEPNKGEKVIVVPNTFFVLKYTEIKNLQFTVKREKKILGIININKKIAEGNLHLNDSGVVRLPVKNSQASKVTTYHINVKSDGLNLMDKKIRM